MLYHGRVFYLHFDNVLNGMVLGSTCQNDVDVIHERRRIRETFCISIVVRMVHKLGNDSVACQLKNFVRDFFGEIIPHLGMDDVAISL